MAFVVIGLMWVGVFLFWIADVARRRQWPIRQYGSQLHLGLAWRARVIECFRPVGLALLGSFPLDVLIETRTWFGVLVMLGLYGWVGHLVFRRVAHRAAIIDLATDIIVDQGRIVGHP